MNCEILCKLRMTGRALHVLKGGKRLVGGAGLKRRSAVLGCGIPRGLGMTLLLRGYGVRSLSVAMAFASRAIQALRVWGLRMMGLAVLFFAAGGFGAEKGKPFLPVAATLKERTGNLVRWQEDAAA